MEDISNSSLTFIDVLQPVTRRKCIPLKFTQVTNMMPTTTKIVIMLFLDKPYRGSKKKNSKKKDQKGHPGLEAPIGSS